MPSLSEFDYDLPRELIAQQPIANRDDARLLVVDRQRQSVEHSSFRDIGRFLAAGDILVLNDTRVLRARVHLRKQQTGGQAELLLCHGELQPDGAWQCQGLAHASKPFRPGMRLCTLRGEPVSHATVVAVHPGGWLDVRLDGPLSFAQWLDRHGELPLPPYIRRDAPLEVDERRYQTVFAATPGAVAAPTAGLHFTAERLQALLAAGVDCATITLHVGPGTFLPVREDDYSRHAMHSEAYEVSPETAKRLNAARRTGGKLVAVGTTSVRTLETVTDAAGQLHAGRGQTALFVTPGHRFRAVDRLLTNFHLPGSTLILLVAAFVGRDLLLSAYRQAVAERYRFYSYGDAMLVL